MLAVHVLLGVAGGCHPQVGLDSGNPNMALFQCFYRFREYDFCAWSCISVYIAGGSSFSALLDVLLWRASCSSSSSSSSSNLVRNCVWMFAGALHVCAQDALGPVLIGFVLCCAVQASSP
jgi:hypothetical protein